MPRFTEDVNIQPINTSTGAAQGLMSLADRLDSFSNQMAQVQAEKVQAAATEQGTAAGQDLQPGEQPQFQEETFFGGAGKKAYNEGLRAAYLSGIARDNRVALKKIAAENPEDINAFRVASEGYFEGLMDSVEPTARNPARQQYREVQNQYEVQIQGNTIDRVNKEVFAELSSAAEVSYRDSTTAARAGNQQASAGALLESFAIVDQLAITDDAKATMRQQMELGVTTEKYMGDMQRLQDEQGLQSVYDWLDDNETPPKGFTPDEWDTVTAQIQTEANRKAQRQKQESKAEVDALQLQQSEERGAAFIDLSVHADPAKSGQDRKDVNNYYNSIAPDMRLLSPEGYVNAHVDFIRSTGIVPTQMLSDAASVTATGNPQEVMVMANMMGRLQEISSRALKDFSPESKAMALSVSDALRANIPADQAVESARTALYGLTESDRDIISRQTDINKDSLVSSLDSFVSQSPDDGGFDAGILGGLFNSVPDIPVAMRSDYELSYERFMQMTKGNAGQSQQLAYDAIQGNWGVSETGGDKRFMKYAPEAIYSVPGYGDGWIEDQFNEDMESIGAEGAILTIDKATAKEDQPSYPIMQMNPQGQLVPAMDANGDNITWRPDFKLTNEYMATATAPQRAVAQARETRQSRMANRASVIRRGVESRAFRGIPKADREEFIASPEGQEKIAVAITNMQVTGRLDEAEANETRKAFGVGLPAAVVRWQESPEGKASAARSAAKKEATQKMVDEARIDPADTRQAIKDDFSGLLKALRADAKKKYGRKS